MRHASVFWFASAVAVPLHAQAFERCEDARNYGENSARLMVSQAAARVGCDRARLALLPRALTRIASLQVLRGGDSDEHKLCYYDGYWDGLITQVRVEYARCDDEPPSLCLPMEVTVDFASGLLNAAMRSLADPAALDLLHLHELLTYTLPAPSAAPLCAPLDALACREQLERGLSSDALLYLEDSTPEIASVLCEIEASL